MKTTIILLTLLCSTAFAKTLSFKGNLEYSEAYPMLEGRRCWIDLEAVNPRGGEIIAFKATPEIKDVSRIFARDKAPTPMRVNDYILTIPDENVNLNDLVLSGEKDGKKLYVFFNNKFEITSWAYTDSAKTKSGFTFNCK